MFFVSFLDVLFLWTEFFLQSELSVFHNSRENYDLQYTLLPSQTLYGLTNTLEKHPMEVNLVLKGLRMCYSGAAA